MVYRGPSSAPALYQTHSPHRHYTPTTYISWPDIRLLKYPVTAKMFLAVFVKFNEYAIGASLVYRLRGDRPPELGPDPESRPCYPHLLFIYLFSLPSYWVVDPDPVFKISRPLWLACPKFGRLPVKLKC